MILKTMIFKGGDATKVINFKDEFLNLIKEI